jgi:FkbM family methyltransferase
VDPIAAFIRISGQYHPPLAARVEWIRERRRRNPALRIMERLVGQGDVVVDIGASWGLYAWQLARLVGPRGHVHAIEPNPAVARSLRAMRRASGNMTVYGLALSETTGEAELHIPVLAGDRLAELASLGVAANRDALSYERVRVRLEPLDGLLAGQLSKLTFIKCDVEGHELAVLRGADRALREARPSLLIEIEQRHQAKGSSIERTFDHLLARDYVGFAVRDRGLRPLAEFDLRRDQLAWLGPEFMPYGMPDGYVHDFLFVRPGTDVSTLLAPPDASASSRPRHLRAVKNPD